MSNLRQKGKATLLALSLGAAIATPATAQVIIGGAKPEVTVDTSVLDRLGNEPTLPDLLLGRRPTAQPVAVTPPPFRGESLGRAAGAPTSIVKLHKPIHRSAHKSAHKQAEKQVKTAKASTAAITKVASTALTTPAPAASAPPPPPVEAAVKPATEPTPSAETTKPVVEAVKADSADKVVAEAVKPAAEAVKPAAEAPKPAESDKPAATELPKPTTEAKVVPVSTQASAAPAVPPPAPLVVATAVSPLPASTAPAVAAPPAASAPAVNLPPALPTHAADAPAPRSQEARLPAAATDGLASIPFEKDGARLPDTARDALVKLAGRLAADATLEVQLLAYAEGDEDNASKARRLSLSRALNVRSFLIDQGVRSTRIEVRALGNKVPEGPADRVDVVVQKR